MKKTRQSDSVRKNISMDVLRSLVAIEEFGGFTQAGEALGRSQSAVSLQVKKLEELIGKPLFDRFGSSFVINNDGRLLLDYARQILALNDRVLAQLDERAVEGRVRLGIPSEFATTLLPKIVGQFSTENPNVTLEVNCDLSKNLLQEIKKGKTGKYDLVLGLHSPPSDAGRYLIKTDDLVWVSHREFDSEQQSLSLIAAPEGCIYRSSASEELKKKGLPWRVVYTIPDLSGICAALEEGLGVTVLAKSTVPKNLKSSRKTKRLPNLGKIGISLIPAKDNKEEVCKVLQSYIENTLTERL